MRSMKFRGKRIDNGEWKYGYYVYVNDKHYIFKEHVWWEVIPETAGQYTGLKDRNGKEAYEKDRVRGTIDGELHEWAIEWEETDAYCGWSIGLDNIPFEIIDNVHQNPELIEK